MDKTTYKEYKVHSIDLIEKQCEVCNTITYPSLLSSIEDIWEYSYVCIDCVSNQTNGSKESISELVTNAVNNKNINAFVDTSWTEGEQVKGLFDMFKVMEASDANYIKNLELWKVHSYLDGLKRGLVLYSEEEMIDYLNFYGNNIDTVTTLQYLMCKDISNKFIMNTYIDSRTKRLTKDQVEALKRNKHFDFLSIDARKFWGKIHKLHANIDTETDEKIKNIVNSIVNYGFYTEKQKDYVGYYIREQEAEHLGKN